MDGARYIILDIKNFFHVILMGIYEYTHMLLEDIPEEIVN